MAKLKQIYQYNRFLRNKWIHIAIVRNQKPHKSIITGILSRMVITIIEMQKKQTRQLLTMKHL